MTNEKNIRLNDTQKKLVEEYYYLAKLVLNACFSKTDSDIYKKYSMEDAHQDACYALCMAASKFDTNHKSSASFKSFASVCIRNYILRMINNHYKKCNNEISLDTYEDNNSLDSSITSNEIEELHQHLQFEYIFNAIKFRADSENKDSKYFQMFLLHYHNGIKVNDIAAKYNITSKRVYDCLTHAKKELQTQFCAVSI